MRQLDAPDLRTLFVSADGGQQQLVELLAREPVDALVLRTLSIDAEMIALCPTLRVISRHGAGFNGVDVAAATKRNIPVFIAPAANSQSVAEAAIGLVFAVARNISGHAAAFQEGLWNRTEIGVQLSGLTMGLYGLGAIGRKVASIAHAVGMRVVAHDRFVNPTTVPVNVELIDNFEDFLRDIDVLSIHCPLTDETKGRINGNALALMKRGALVVNTARGPIIDEPAMIAALQSGQIAGAGFDTLAEEPPAADHPYRRMSNVIVTPHIGGNTTAALNSVAAISVENAVSFLRGKTPDRSFCVNPSTLN
ncbi:MAG: hydroxyacid dehydrogenase [Ensifer sp. SSB1]|nr:hydroxyacid dehydrogenase [Ensifer sp. SSB1]